MPDTDSNKQSASKTAPAIRAYLGGSFDPVHNGHIQMAMYVYHSLLPIAEQQQRLLHVSLLPNACSPFKTQSTDPAHRLAMLTLAIQNTPLQVSELELWQTPPVYSIDSVRTLRQRYPNDSLIFIMGMDSARGLEKWKDGLQLTDYVHLWVFDRSSNLASNFATNLINSSDVSQKMASTDKDKNQQHLSAQHLNTLSAELPIQLRAQITRTQLDLMQPLNSSSKNITHQGNKPLKSNAQGRIYIDSRSVLAISSTDTRKQLRQQRHKQLPTDDLTVSNKPNNLTHLLNPAVYQYIIAHQLYSAAQFR
ncbi:nicotinate-nicotinamide nucleotide adenylyltransferase [Psychrobacter sp. 72-O-c]|uniref:nicotinate-nicotinamide nucleotide adenylyltransferase n=1 Tax=Psychrobacter sp. 72-O-c TaxID=2774125 RepID=UPI001917DE7E|nr:nicotinate-nicotinamide nucleotide adenylyltransferase [Psychrobacter sp. 72-O-c]